ncbi:MAG: hypothetical protein AAF823_01105 [Planctomycetota bacterium]
MSENRLAGLLHDANPDRVIDAVVRGGLPLSLTLRVRLAASPSACRGLLLRRLTDISFGPTRLSRSLTKRLLDDQASDGGWEGDPLATACVVAALARVTAEHRADDAPQRALRRGVVWLGSRQGVGGGLRLDDDARPAVAASVGALVLYLLDRVPEAWAVLRRSDLTEAVVREGDPRQAAERLLLEMVGEPRHDAFAAAFDEPDPASSNPRTPPMADREMAMTEL